MRCGSARSGRSDVDSVMWSGQARWGNAGRVMYGQARSGADGFGKVWQAWWYSVSWG